MEFSLIAGLVAGLAATTAMSLLMRMSAAMGMTDMPPMELVTGSMMAAEETRARQLGTVVHWLVMGTIVFGLGYAAVFAAVGSASALSGLLLGAAHGVVVGVLFMPMMPAMHPRMSSDPGIAGTAGTVDGIIQLRSPGVLGARWGGMTPVGMILGHIVYGLVAALVYGAVV